VALDGKHGAFSELYELGSPVAVPPTPSHRSGQWAMGAFGVVFIAKQRAPPYEVVGVKLTKSKLEDYIDAEGCRRARWVDRYAADSHHHCLLEEAHVHRKASALGSRHICRLVGAYEVPVELSALVKANEDEPGVRLRLALVLEFYTAQNLRHVVTQSEKLPGVMTPQTPGSPRVRAYSEVDKRNMFAPIAQALLELHRAGIVHRDIKPDNIVMKAAPTPGACPELSIIDFGLAIDLSRGDVRWGRNSIIGDKAYAAPELFEGDGSTYLSRAGPGHHSGTAHDNRYLPPVDVYALGVTLYIFLLGFHETAQLDSVIYSDLPYDYPPRHDWSFAQHLRARRAPLKFHQPAHAHALLAGLLSDHARDLLARMLEVDPAKRITMRELLVHPWVTDEGSKPLLHRGALCPIAKCCHIATQVGSFRGSPINALSVAP
jgi:serine/threonine protein kinase